MHFNKREDDNKIDVLEERLRNWMNTTTDFRNELTKKIEDIDVKIESIRTKMESFPCDERRGWYTQTTNQLKALWIIVWMVVAAIIAEWVKTK